MSIEPVGAAQNVPLPANLDASRHANPRRSSGTAPLTAPNDSGARYRRSVAAKNLNTTR